MTDPRLFLQGFSAEGDPLREGRDILLIDVCLYFIAPHRFTPMDQELFRQLDEEVTVVPICAKADAMIGAERQSLQQLILSELQARELLHDLARLHCVPFMKCPACAYDAATI